jgi:adenylate kinase
MNILLIGKPGAGKGTITKLLENEGFLQLSTGDLLRAEIATGSEMGKEIDQLLLHGKFATDEMIFEMVDGFLNKNIDKSIIFDGFPRNLKQAKTCFNNSLNFDKIFVLNIEDSVLEERIVNRRVHPKSGRVYNIKTMPPREEGKDDFTGEPLVQRNDDKPEVLANRLKEYKSQTEPIIEYFKSIGMNIIELDASGPIEKQLIRVKEELSKTTKPKFKQ